MEDTGSGEIIDTDTKFLVATHLSGERTVEEVIKLFKQTEKGFKIG